MKSKKTGRRKVFAVLIVVLLIASWLISFFGLEAISAISESSSSTVSISTAESMYYSKLIPLRQALSLQVS